MTATLQLLASLERLLTKVDSNGLSLSQERAKALAVLVAQARAEQIADLFHSTPPRRRP